MGVGRRLSRLTPLRLLVLLVSLATIFSLYLNLSPLSEPCNCQKNTNSEPHGAEEDDSRLHGPQPNEDPCERQASAKHRRELAALGDDPSWGEHKICIIVPFRNRFEELLDFAPHMHKFLNAQRVRHKLVIVNQGDKHRFNRAALINLGFQETRDECDYMAMHDVDLLPLNPELKYTYPQDGPLHLAAPDLHPRYHYKTFVGGILLLTREHFEKADGLSNRYWGWGREDDEFYVRMVEAKLTIFRPQNITTGYDTFKHEHDKVKRPRDFRRYGDQNKSGRHRDYKTGLSTIHKNIKSVSSHESKIDAAPVTILNVELDCDYDDTPWCVHPEQLAKIQNDKLTQLRFKEAADAEIASQRLQIEQAKLKIMQAQEAEKKSKHLQR